MQRLKLKYREKKRLEETESHWCGKIKVLCEIGGPEEMGGERIFIGEIIVRICLNFMKTTMHMFKKLKENPKKDFFQTA